MCVCLVAKSCPTLGGPIDCSPPGSSVHGVLQARKLISIAISFSRRSSRPRDQTHTLAGGLFTTVQQGSPEISEYKTTKMKAIWYGHMKIKHKIENQEINTGMYRN